MRRIRHKNKSGIDLIGFLDILSVVMVIVLLVISVLALSIGIQGRTLDTVEDPVGERPQETAGEPPPSALVKMTTVDGQNITVETTFLLCKGVLLKEFDPNTGERVRSWNLSTDSSYEIANSIGAPNVYLAIAGSCFSYLDALVDAFRSSGSQLGYEPTTEDAIVPWQ